MRRFRSIVGLALVFASTMGCGQAELEQRLAESERMHEASERRNERYKKAATAKDEYIKSITTMLNRVTDRIELMRTEELALLSLTVIGEARGRAIADDHRVPETLDRVRGILNENRAEIEILESALANADDSLAELVVMTRRLHAENEALEDRIGQLRKRAAALSGRVKKLETEVVALSSENTEKDVQLAEREAEVERAHRKLVMAEQELQRVFYRVGSVRDLRKAGIMRGRKRLSPDLFPGPARFRISDRRILRRIDLGGERSGIRLLPPRSTGSYQIQIGNGRSWLVILDPKAFWRNPFVVVAYKR